MKRFYIKKSEYDTIRKDLVSRNNELVKIALQNLITKLEYGQRINMACTKDLCAVMFDIIRNNDYKIRKWAYHLIAYKYNCALIDRCIQNLTSGFESDEENISWILAIASRSLESDKICYLFKKYATNQISQRTYNICSTLFSRDRYVPSTREVNSIVNSEDFLAKMWLTKAFACDYIPEKKKSYSLIVNADIMNAFLQDESIQRYALWAFSTLDKVNISIININPYDAINLPSKSLAWYYTGLFKDDEYIQAHLDHIINILEDFLEYPLVVQMGILRGISCSECSLKGFLYPLVSAYLELDEDNNKQLPLLILFTRILIDHEKESTDISDVLQDCALTTRRDELKALLWYRQANVLEGLAMGTTITINGNVGGIQNNDGVTPASQTNNLIFTTSDSALNPLIIDSTLKELKERLKSGEFDNLFDGENSELFMLSEKMQYGFNLVQDYNIQEKNIIDMLIKIDSDLQNLNKTHESDKKKSLFADMLTKASQLCSISVNLPKLWPVLKDTLDFIKTFLHIN